nr:ORF163 [Cavernulicola chilensis]
MKINTVLNPQYSIMQSNYNFNCFFLFQEIRALIRRLLIQLSRRPSTLIAGIIQPLLWLILFGALFQNAPVGMFSHTNSYMDFLTPGVIVFTAFAGALNASLPVMFDREFGFLNRLLIVPLISRVSIISSSAFTIATISIVQVIVLIFFSNIIGISIPNFPGLSIVIFIILLLTIGITFISLLLAFILPGHIELLAIILVINLPLLFASTALAPLNFMPPWLQIIASLNPLTYAIEAIRSIYLNLSIVEQKYTIENIWGNLNLSGVVKILLVFDFCALLILRTFLVKKLK